VVGDNIEMEAERVGQSKKYRPCKHYDFTLVGGDPLDIHINNSTRGHEIVHDIRDAVMAWKENWKKVKKVSKNIEIVDNGVGQSCLVVRTWF
jgi:hypothetical protein